MTYLLDTNIVVFCLRGKSPHAMRRLHAVPAVEVAIPLQAHAELLVGAARSTAPMQSKDRLLAFLSPFVVVCPDARVEEHYVAIRTDLEGRGLPISEADLWIAATARALGGAVVTNTVREFSRVASLRVEDWTVS